MTIQTYNIIAGRENQEFGIDIFDSVEKFEGITALLAKLLQTFLTFQAFSFSFNLSTKASIPSATHLLTFPKVLGPIHSHQSRKQMIERLLISY